MYIDETFANILFQYEYENEFPQRLRNEFIALNKDKRQMKDD